MSCLISLAVRVAAREECQDAESTKPVSCYLKPEKQAWHRRSMFVISFLLLLQGLRLGEVSSSSLAQDPSPAQQNRATHLSQYNQAASSSSFGEPVFRLEPPSVINLVNWQGATIPCLASGSPKPTITWYSTSSNSNSRSQQHHHHLSGELSRLVANVTNLRHITSNGAVLRLLPFKEVDFRPEIHSTEYRCVASNDLGSIHSRIALVQAGEFNAVSIKLAKGDLFRNTGSWFYFSLRLSFVQDIHRGMRTRG